MRISDDARECSVFLGYPEGAGETSDIAVCGTGFLVYVKGGGARSMYLVTAAHVAHSIGSDPFAVRLNSNEGGARLDRIDSAKWHFHANKNVDIAVMEYDPPRWAASMVLPADEFIDDEIAHHFNIGAGDPVQIVGLFHLHYGRGRNLPVVHTGHIALVPTDEAIPMGRAKDGGVLYVNGYLVEAHGLEGSSGSPAYVRATIPFVANDVSAEDAATKIHGFSAAYLLGIWVGAWSGEPDDTLKRESHVSRARMVPVGMGIVIPATRIWEVFNMPDLVEARRLGAEAVEDARAAMPLSLPREQALPDNPDHREDFTALLRKASKSKPEGGQT